MKTVAKIHLLSSLIKAFLSPSPSIGNHGSRSSIHAQPSHRWSACRRKSEEHRNHLNSISLIKNPVHFDIIQPQLIESIRYEALRYRSTFSAPKSRFCNNYTFEFHQTSAFDPLFLSFLLVCMRFGCQGGGSGGVVACGVRGGLLRLTYCFWAYLLSFQWGSDLIDSTWDERSACNWFG